MQNCRSPDLPGDPKNVIANRLLSNRRRGATAVCSDRSPRQDAMKTRLRLPERRSADRPSNGDTRPCPKCAAGVLEFNERYRLPLASGRTVVMAAWACDQADCRYVRPARRADRDGPPLATV